MLEGVKAPETVQPDAAAAIPAGAAASHATPQNEGEPADANQGEAKPEAGKKTGDAAEQAPKN